MEKRLEFRNVCSMLYRLDFICYSISEPYFTIYFIKFRLQLTVFVQLKRWCGQYITLRTNRVFNFFSKILIALISKIINRYSGKIYKNRKMCFEHKAALWVLMLYGILSWTRILHSFPACDKSYLWKKYNRLAYTLDVNCTIIGFFYLVTVFKIM